MAEKGALHVHGILQENRRRNFLAAMYHGLRPANGEATEHAMARRIRELQVLQHREVFVDRWGLEFPANARTDDPMLGQSADFLVPELDAALGRSRLPANEIEDRRLAGAIWPDDDAQ